MRFTSLGSGSRGNALVVSAQSTTILVDCGLPLKVLRSALARAGLSTDDLDGIFVTHEHSDHIRGLRALARQTDAPFYMTMGTALAADWIDHDRLQIVKDMTPVAIGCMTVIPVIVPHDAREPCQFVIEQVSGLRKADEPVKKLGILTDLGSASPHVIDAYHHCDALVLECNHDIQLLRQGSYPPSLKSRVLSDWGHLSNCQARHLFNALQLDDLQWLVLAHISQQNNSTQLAVEAMQSVFPTTEKMLVADQEHGFDWLTIH